MLKPAQIFLASICLSPVMLLSFVNTEKVESSPSNYRCIEVKHIEGKGVGYQKGYSTLEGFFVHLSHLDQNWVPFLDMRVHVFNDGQPDVNAGVGFRYLNTRVWGVNAYYDYRKTTHFHYNQVGVGLESLGKIWDFRLNGYFPVGEKHSRPYHVKFHQFKGHHIILKNKLEFAMTGGSAEIGAHAYHRKNFDVYAAAGPYYLTGQGRSAWGGEARLALTIVDHLRLQASCSYDSIFKGIGQGEISLFWTWGEKKIIQRHRSRDCDVSRWIIDRALQRVDRQEIIVLDHQHQTSKAINPVTGDPYLVWFVNNLSHSLGTFESPFPTLIAAQTASGPNDIIYVYPGDGSDNGMDAGIILKNGQQLLGAGIDHSILIKKGTFTIPAQTTGLPVISNLNDPTGLGVQLTNGNNIVSGLFLPDKVGTKIFPPFFTAGLSIMGGSNYSISQNIFSTFGIGDGLQIYGDGNNTTIVNNTFLGTDNGFNISFGIFIAPNHFLAPVGGKITVENNLFSGIDGSTALGEAVNFSFLTDPLAAVGRPTTLAISNNKMNLLGTALSDAGAIVVFNAINVSNPLKVSINNNLMIVPPSSQFVGVLMTDNSGAPPVIASLRGNVVRNSPPALGYSFVNEAPNPPSNFQLNFVNNVGTRTGEGINLSMPSSNYK